MIFYKLLAGGLVLDVNTVFLRWQPRHAVMLVCEPAKAEFVCPRDGSAVYHPDWLNKPPAGAVYDGDIDCEEIDEETYDRLLAQLEAGEEVPGNDICDILPEQNTQSDPVTPPAPTRTVAQVKELVEQMQALTDEMADLKKLVRGYLKEDADGT